jgi:hypothetical protein
LNQQRSSVLTRFLHVNRYPPSDQVQGHASLRHGTAAFEAFTTLLILEIHSNASASQELYHRDFGGFLMTSRLNESIIDEIVARCNGDIRGALQALLLVNERLEAELEQLQAAVAQGEMTVSGNNLLH